MTNQARTQHGNTQGLSRTDSAGEEAIKLTMRTAIGTTFSAQIECRAFGEALVDGDDAASAEQVLEWNLTEAIESCAKTITGMLCIARVDIETEGGYTLDATIGAEIETHVMAEIGTSATHRDGFNESWRASATQALIAHMKAKAWRLLVRDLGWARRICALKGNQRSVEDTGTSHAKRLLNLTGRRVLLTTISGGSATLEPEPLPEAITQALAPPGRLAWHGLDGRDAISPPAGSASDAAIAFAITGAIAESGASAALVAEPILAQLVRARARCDNGDKTVIDEAVTDTVNALAGRVATPEPVTWQDSVMHGFGVRTL